jgi:hypothetical protein
MAWLESPYDYMHVGSFFSLTYQDQIGGKTPALTVSRLRLLIKNMLPIKQFNHQEITELIKWNQMRNHRAYISHRKRKLAGQSYQ